MQRVAIARALVTRPRLLLADEPTGNLDSRTGLEIMSVLQRLNAEGLTILMVTHEADMARFVDRVLVLRDGLVRTDRAVDRESAARALSEWRDDAEIDMDQEVVA